MITISIINPITNINVQIKWGDRLNTLPINNAYLTIDGTDVPIQEPSPWSRHWYSHKLHGAGLRYEIGVSLQGYIVWANGPFPCGQYPDVKIFREALKARLGDEMVIADRGYRDDKCLTPNNVHVQYLLRRFSVLRARHETLNKRLKQFAILQRTYRHNIDMHHYVFFAVAHITQVCLDTEPLFVIEA